MGVKIKRGYGGDTPLSITHRVLNDHCGYNDPDEKAKVANQILGTSVRRIEDLSDNQLAKLSHELVRTAYNGG
jgi:hypothetical protein